MRILGGPWGGWGRTAALLVMLVVGCAAPPGGPKPVDSPALQRLAPASFPEFADDMALDGLTHAVGQSLRYLESLPSDTPFAFGPDTYTAQHLKASLDRFLSLVRTQPNAEALQSRLAAEFRVYKAAGREKTKKVLFTGYYEPVLSGASAPTATHRYPVYQRPDDLVEADLARFSDRYPRERIIGRLEGQALVPYYDREQIDTLGVLAGRARVLAWVRDPVNLFFLHIQGSGRIVMTDGTTLNVHYSGKNGRPYRSIGRLLIDSGEIPADQMSMQAIRRWLQRHSDRRDEILNANPSYVFFESVDTGPLGCLNVVLTPGRSVATDRRVFPMAALAYASVQKPLIDGDGTIRSWRRLHRFVLNQDTGGAIRGPGRADLFFGGGRYAEMAAGHLQHDGDLYFLVLDPAGPPAPDAQTRPDRNGGRSALLLDTTGQTQ